MPNNLHSDPYSCIGYVCGYLRYHYPYEFLTTALNTFVSDNKETVAITQYANKNGISILPPKFGHSSAEYRMNKHQHAIYKGLSSVKYIGSDIGDKLYELGQNVPETFLEFLKVNPCDSRQTEILIYLGFFDVYGKRRKLLDLVELFNYLYKKQNGVATPKKMFKKDSVVASGYAPSLFEKYSTGTKLQYQLQDADSLFNEIASFISDDEMPVEDILNQQMDALGYIEYTDISQEGLYFVLDVDTKYSTKVKLYEIATGQIIDAKSKKSNLVEKNFNKTAILRVKTFIERNKKQFVDGKWVDVPDVKELWMDYDVVRVQTKKAKVKKK